MALSHRRAARKNDFIHHCCSITASVPAQPEIIKLRVTLEKLCLKSHTRRRRFKRYD